MPNKDFTANWRKATTAGNLTLAQAWDFSDITALVQAPDRVQLVREPRRAGNFAVRVECKENDIDGDTRPSERTEIFTTSAFQSTYAVGDTVWIATSLYVPKSFPNSTSWHLVHQMHEGAQVTSPPWSLYIESGYWKLNLRGGAQPVAGVAARSVAFDIAPVTKGVWCDFLFKLYLDTTAGYCESYYRECTGGVVPSFPVTPQTTQAQTLGANVVSISGTNQLQTPPRISIYRDTRPDPTVVYHGGYIARRTREHAEALWTDTDAYSTAVLADAPSRYFRLNGAGAPTDLGSQAVNATLQASPTTAQTSLLRNGDGASMNFSPTNSYVLASGGTAVAYTANEWTYELIVKTSVSAGNKYLLVEGNSGNNTARCAIWMQDKILADFFDNAGTLTRVTGGAFPNYTTISDGEPHHVLCRWSKTTGIIELFVDGELEARATGFSPGATTYNQLSIGAWRGSATNGPAGNVTIQEAAVYPTWLSDDRVQVHANAAFRESVASVPAGPVGWAEPLIYPNGGRIRGSRLARTRIRGS